MALPDESPRPEDSPREPRQGQGGGPKTSFGKAASSQNSTTHGLTARYRLADHVQRDVDERLTFYVPRFQPRDDDDHFLCAQAAIGYVQNRHALGDAFTYLRIRSERAQLYWNLDRSADAALLGCKLARNPSAIAPRLAGSLHGARWMLERWEHLRELLLMEGAGVWLEDAVSMAYDLLGIDPAIRSTDPKKIARGGMAERMAVVDAEMARLRELTDGDYIDHDRDNRMREIAGESARNDPHYRRLMRYAREGQLLNERCLRELERRRVARGLPAYNPDGSPCHPIDPPGTPPRPEPEPLPDHEAVFFRPEDAPGKTFQEILDQLPHRPRPEAQRERRAQELAPAPAPPPEPARPRLNAEEARQRANEARLKQEADRRRAREEKDKKRAERKAAKAARVRGRKS